jgi:outer membrane protein assembly factor BamB
VIWTYDTRLDGDPVEFHGDPLLTEEMIVVGSDLRKENGAGRIYAFARDNGIPRWTHPAGQGVATDLPAIGGTLFAVTFADELIALDIESGSLLWSFATGAPNQDFVISSSPAVAADRVFFGGLDGVLYALDAQTGAPVWNRRLGDRVSTSAFLAGGSLYAGTLDGRLHKLDPGTGEVTASLKTEEPPAGRLSAAGGCLLTFLGERGIGCAELSLDRLRWTRSHPKGWSSSRPYPWRGFLLAANDSNGVVALRLADGEPAWSVTLGGIVRGIGITDEALYLGTLKGMVYAHSLPPLR